MSRSRPVARTTELTRLRSLVEVLGALDVQPGDPARIVRVRDDHAGGLADATVEDAELGFLDLEPGDHPLAFLAGFVAPADWSALGVVCTGRARHLDEPSGAAPVRVAQVVARSGAWASSWVALGAGAGRAAAALADGGSTSSGGPDDAPTGRVDDALRRALGLPTPPPPTGTELLWATQWFDALLVGAADGAPARRARRRRSLPALVAQHPAVAAFDHDPARVTVAGLVAAGARLSALRTWTGLRQACAGGRWHDPEVPAAVAAWLDDGAFARWVLGGYPDLAQLRGALGELLAPSALSVLDDALAGWGLAVDPGPAG